MTAAGPLYSDAAAKIAVLAKTTRNAMIGFVVLGYPLYWARKEGTARVGNKAAFLWEKFPKFVQGFLLISALATAGIFAEPQLTSLANLSRWAFLLTFADVGLRTNFRERWKQGARPFLVGGAGEIVIVFLTLGLVFGAGRFLHERNCLARARERYGVRRRFLLPQFHRATGGFARNFLAS